MRDVATEDCIAQATLPVAGTTLHWGTRTYVMGILNVTPDSFSGDGIIPKQLNASHSQSWLADAVTRAQMLAAAGADILDIGGESSRPGAAPVSAEEEITRVIPAIAAIRAKLTIPISIDTTKAEVALAALDAGANMINDIWGLRISGGGWNEALARVAATRQVPIILMHNRRAILAASGGHYQKVKYTDLLGDILREIRESISYAQGQGILREHIIIDPGIGFGKTPVQNVEVLRQLKEFRVLGLPILLGTSRKSFIGLVLNTEPDDRVEGTAATVALGIGAGVDIVRVHDVAPMVRVARVADAIVRGWDGPQ